MTGVVWPRLAGGLPPLLAPCLMEPSESAILGTLPMGLVVEVSPVGSKSLKQSPRIVHYVDSEVCEVRALPTLPCRERNLSP